jgi:hypothetical protein
MTHHEQHSIRIVFFDFLHHFRSCKVRTRIRTDYIRSSSENRAFTSDRNSFHWRGNNQRWLSSGWSSKHRSKNYLFFNSLDSMDVTCDSAISNIGDKDRIPWNKGIQSTKWRYDDESASSFAELVRSLKRMPFTASSGYLAMWRNIFVNAKGLISDISREIYRQKFSSMMQREYSNARLSEWHRSNCCSVRSKTRKPIANLVPSSSTERHLHRGH